MKSIHRRFLYEKENDLSHYSYIHFVNAVKGQYYSKEQLSRYFGKYVDKEHYAKNEKKAIIAYIYEEIILKLTKKRGKSVHRASKKHVCDISAKKKKK